MKAIKPYEDGGTLIVLTSQSGKAAYCVISTIIRGILEQAKARRQ